jgi:hypothetical protein
LLDEGRPPFSTPFVEVTLMRSRSCLAILAVALAIGPSIVAAQQPWPLELDQRVRISSPGARGVFVVQSVSSGEIMLAQASGEMLTVSTGSITRLDVSRGPRPRSAGFGRGLAFGFLGGALVGIVTGLADGDDVCEPTSWCIFQMSAEEKALAGGVAFGALGGLAGGVVGAALPGERWQRVTPRAHWTLTPAPGGSIAVVASLRRE